MILANRLSFNLKKNYFYRLFHAFYRLAKAFWQQRRSNFIGVAIVALTVGTLLGSELYADLRWLLSARQLLAVYSSVPLSVGTELLQALPIQTIGLFAESAFDSNGNFKRPILSQTAEFSSDKTAGPEFAYNPGSKFIRWPDWEEPGLSNVNANKPAKLPNKANHSDATVVESAAVSNPAVENTPKPPSGNGRYYWVKPPQVTPRGEFHYGPLANATPPNVAASDTAAGGLRERRAGNSSTLATNTDW